MGIMVGFDKYLIRHLLSMMQVLQLDILLGYVS
jgi:hypothetical protein